jgi:hypothetical protein
MSATLGCQCCVAFGAVRTQVRHNAGTPSWYTAPNSSSRCNFGLSRPPGSSATLSHLSSRSRTSQRWVLRASQPCGAGTVRIQCWSTLGMRAGASNRAHTRLGSRRVEDKDCEPRLGCGACSVVLAGHCDDQLVTSRDWCGCASEAGVVRLPPGEWAARHAGVGGTGLQSIYS